MSLILISSGRFAEHQTPPGHPECPERADVMEAVAARWRAEGGEVVAPREATHEQLARVHDTEYLSLIAGTAGRAVSLDPDTYTSPQSYDVALLAAGAAVDAVERAIGASHTMTFALVRPPGHHAERRRAMGFCVFNNVAVASLYARRRYDAERVAVVDFDVHHGNGTQDIFWSDRNCFYGSTHQMPLYPGTGAVEETGIGNIFNAPLRAGDGSDRFREAMRAVILPALNAFGPDLIVISAGFDAHRSDPLGSLELTEEDFVWATLYIMDMADKHADSRVVSVLEGGYDLAALASSVGVHVQALMRGTGDLERVEIEEEEEDESDG